MPDGQWGLIKPLGEISLDLRNIWKMIAICFNVAQEIPMVLA